MAKQNSGQAKAVGQERLKKRIDGVGCGFFLGKSLVPSIKMIEDSTRRAAWGIEEHSQERRIGKTTSSGTSWRRWESGSKTLDVCSRNSSSWSSASRTSTSSRSSSFGS